MPQIVTPPAFHLGVLTLKDFNVLVNLATAEEPTELTQEYPIRKLAHGASAAAFAGAGAAVLGKDIGTAATGAAFGAITAEIVAEALSAPLNEEVFEEVKKREAETGHALTKDQKIEITRSKVEDLAKIAKLSGAISGLVTGSAQGLSTAGSAANTAIDHNFLMAAVPLLIAGYLIYEEVTTCVETDDAIVSDPLGEALLMPAVGKTAKLAKGTARVSKEVLKDLAGASKSLVSNEVGAIGPVPEGYVKVSRWTSEVEAQAWMKEGATAIPSEIGANQRLYVTTHGAPKPGGTGPVRIDFEVPEAMLQGAGNVEWRQVLQPQTNTPIYNVQINLP